MLHLEMIYPERCGRLTASVVGHSDLGVGIEWWRGGCQIAAVRAAAILIAGAGGDRYLRVSV